MLLVRPKDGKQTAYENVDEIIMTFMYLVIMYTTLRSFTSSFIQKYIKITKRSPTTPVLAPAHFLRVLLSRI